MSIKEENAMKEALNKNPSVSEDGIIIRPPKKLSDLTPEKGMRNANIRISRVNKIKTDNEKLGLKAGDTYIIEKNDIIAVLEEWRKHKPFDYFLIEHNEDKENIHYHLVIVFHKGNSAQFKTIKNKFPYGDIERCGNVAACVQYLIHKNHPEKHQYDAKEIVTNSPGKLENYLLYQIGLSPKAQFNKVKEQILSGQLKACDIDKIDPDIYIKFSRQIKAAFELRRKTALKSPKRELTCVVVQGNSRLGKSTYAKIWAEKHNKTYRYSAAGKNLFESYQDEDVYILDDCDHTGLKISDFIKLTDPNINVPLPARYHDVFLLADTLFIITNTNFLRWYEDEDDRLREAVFKRISCVLTFEATEKEYVSAYTKNSIAMDESKTGIDRFYLVPTSEPKLFELSKHIDINKAVKSFDDEI